MGRDRTVSFSYSTLVANPGEVKAALEAARDRHLVGLGINPTARALDNPNEIAVRSEVTDLTQVAAKALTAAVRALPAAGAYRLSVSGHRDAAGIEALSLSVTALRS
jgi:hypothetical protein